MYNAYVPDPLAGRPLVFDASDAADIADAEREIALLDAGARALADTEALARLLLRAESIASSFIEGLAVGPRRLLSADAALDQNDVTAQEVLGNIEASAFALKAIEERRTFALDDLLEVHRRLLHRTSIAEHGGRVRTEQNWIGGSSYNPCSAVFVPPPPELVPELLEDLCVFCNEDNLPAVAQAAIAHAQFEAIHPLTDGNGRVGRILIQMILRRRGLCTRVTLPVSLVLATQSRSYIEGLNAMCYEGPPDGQTARDATNLWVSRFSAACKTAAREALAFEQRITALQERWRRHVGHVRSDSAVMKLIGMLPGAPIITSSSAREMLGQTPRSTLDAIYRLEKAGVLHAMRGDRQRGKAWEARAIIDEFIALDQTLRRPSAPA